MGRKRWSYGKNSTVHNNYANKISFDWSHCIFVKMIHIRFFKKGEDDI